VVCFSAGSSWACGSPYQQESISIDDHASLAVVGVHTDKKENQICSIYKEIQSGAVAKSYMRKGFLLSEEMRKYLAIYEEAVSHI
jgi:hypothetical protein